METARWTDVLNLLTMAVVIDKRVYKEEVDVFRKKALELREALSPNMIFSDKMAFDWFMVHRDEVMGWLDAPDSRDRILNHIHKLKDEPGRQKILESMYSISMADKEFHSSEMDIISLAAKHWKLPVPKLSLIHI